MQKARQYTSAGGAIRVPRGEWNRLGFEGLSEEESSPNDIACRVDQPDGWPQT
jgi:hypothetical protein